MRVVDDSLRRDTTEPDEDNELAGLIYDGRTVFLPESKASWALVMRVRNRHNRQRNKEPRDPRCPQILTRRCEVGGVAGFVVWVEDRYPRNGMLHEPASMQ